MMSSKTTSSMGGSTNRSECQTPSQPTTKPPTKPQTEQQQPRQSAPTQKPKSSSKPQWFGSAVTHATNASASIPYNPFPPDLRQVLKPHWDKASSRRQQALAAIRTATDKKDNTTNDGNEESSFDYIMNRFLESPLARRGQFGFDPSQYPLREAFLSSCGLVDDRIVYLSQLHNIQQPSKLEMLRHLTQNFERLQAVYDEFVREVCCPKLAALYSWNDSDDGVSDNAFTSKEKNTEKHSNQDDEWTTKNEQQQMEIYYQCFPCIRIVLPGDFSIGPHADVAYGHHPMSTNFYVLLTDLAALESSAALFLESQPGLEDWHPILGCYDRDGGDDIDNSPVISGDDRNTTLHNNAITHFAGAVCAHWTTENNTDMTRVSLDFRLLPGPLYHALKDGGDEKGGQLDVYRKTDGYYNRCVLSEEGEWERVGPMMVPDARVGFPWTVANWEKLFAKKTND